ncbi:membrane protein, partial [Halobacillus sp. BBL2006]
TIGLVAGIIGVIFRLNNMKINDIAEGFAQGAKDLLPAALVVGMAKGIVIILGGDDPTSASVLNTILHSAGQLFDGVPEVISAWFMFVFQSIFNFFVVSGSGQAALTMPLMAPLADIAGVTRQVAVLAFQLGDGLTNIIVPTSAALMGTLGAARLDWGKWFAFIIKFQLILFGLASVFIIAAVLINFS